MILNIIYFELSSVADEANCVMLVHQSLWLKSSIAVNSSVVHLGKIIFFKAANISVSLLCISSSIYLDRMIWIHFLSLKRIDTLKSATFWNLFYP